MIARPRSGYPLAADEETRMATTDGATTVGWEHSVESAKEKAKTADKLVLLDFFSPA